LSNKHCKICATPCWEMCAIFEMSCYQTEF